MDKLDYILTQLAQTFTARDLMVPKNQLICGVDRESALQQLQAYPQYDVIPIKQKERLTAFVERESEKATIIYPQHVISDATSIFDLVDLFQTRKFYFVVSGNDIAGFLHFADLNNRLVKIPYFVIFETVERTLLQVINGKLTDEVLKNVLDSEMWQRLQTKHEQLRDKDVDLGYGSLLHFSHIVDIATHLGLINLPNEQRDDLVNVRNRVSHSTDPLVGQYNHVNRLGIAKEVCFKLLQKFEAI